MADSTVVHIGENSPEEVAFKLMRVIADLENKDLYGNSSGKADRVWLLRTYAQCLRAVRVPQMIDDVVTEFAPEPNPYRSQ